MRALVAAILLTSCSIWHHNITDMQATQSLHIVKKAENFKFNRTITNYRTGPIRSVVTESKEKITPLQTLDYGGEMRVHKNEESKVSTDIPVLKIAIGLAIILAVGIFLILRKVPGT